MPVIAWITAAYAAGLLAGFSALPWIVAPALIVVLAGAALLDRAPAIAPFVLAAGLMVGSGSMRPPRWGAPPPGVFASARLRMSRTVAHTFPRDSALARALLVGDQREIAPELKSSYADAGIVHMLSISGMHVTIIAGAILLVFRAFRATVRAAIIASVGIVAAYVMLLGMPPPAVRSAVMLGVVALGRLCQRNVSPWGALALGALVPLADPATVLDLGYQLSVGGMAGLFAARALVRRTSLHGAPGLRGAIARAAATSGITTAVTAPLVAAAFGRLSLVAPITNLIADPILALAQPALFLGLLLAPLRPAAAVIADAVHPLLFAFDAVARIGARFPYGAQSVTLSPVATALLLGASVAMIIACAARHPARPAAVALGALLATIAFG